jgi:aconitate hydratase
VLTVTQMLRKKGVVGKFVEFYGTGLSSLDAAGPRHDRQHGAGIWRDDGLLPGGRETLAYLRFTGRDANALRWSRPTEGAGLFRTDERPIRFSPTRSNSISPAWSATMAGPKRPQDACRCAGQKLREKSLEEPAKTRPVQNNGDEFELATARW